MTDVIAAMNQMRAWLAEGTISLEQIMCIASEALDEIERTDRPTDPEFWMDALDFVERMNANAAEVDRLVAGDLLAKIQTARAFSGITEFPGRVLEVVPSRLSKELTAEQLGLVFRAVTTAYYQDRSEADDRPEKKDSDEYGPTSLKVLEGLENVRKRPEGFIAENPPELDSFIRQVAEITDQLFTGRERIEDWETRLFKLMDRFGSNFVYDRKPDDITRIARIASLFLAGRTELEPTGDHELTLSEASFYLGTDQHFVSNALESGKMHSLRLRDLDPFRIKQAQPQKGMKP